jgi:adenine-specific DNA-methyltransferase
MVRSIQRQLGAFYTPHSATELMASWAVRRDNERILEPSFGDGAFLRAVKDSAAERGLTGVHVAGVEIDPLARQHAVNEQLICDQEAFLDDFLSLTPFPVEAVVGNPPYVRLRHLPSDQRRVALGAAEQVLRKPMDPAGSAWMPFVLHAMRFLERGGRLALVLPWEFTYVRYGRPLWGVLGRSFGSLQVLRTHERLFPGLLQDVVILLADGFGGHTEEVVFQAFERVDDLLLGVPVVDEPLSIADIEAGKRSFIRAMLPAKLRDLLDTKVANLTTPARSMVRFNIGYVSGDKRFFHPSPEVVGQYDIPSQSLRPALTSGKSLSGAGLRTSNLPVNQLDRLFVPDPAHLKAGEERYIRSGVEGGAANRYKCRIRDPWFMVPSLRRPDVVLTVFTEQPILVVNDTELLASNSLLCGFSLGPSPVDLAARWYTSLTLLQTELEVHALGGGVMVLVPVEAGNVLLPEVVTATAEHLHALDDALRSNDPGAAYELGDHAVLRGQLGFTDEEVKLLRRGIEILEHWRTSVRTAKRWGSSVSRKYPRRPSAP